MNWYAPDDLKHPILTTENTTTWTKLTYADEGDPLWKRLIIEGIEYASGRSLIQRLYNEVRFLDIPLRDLWALAIEKLELTLDFNEAALEKIPTTGPLVFLGNHPFGVVDGLILAYLVSRKRDDYFLLANEMLTRIPDSTADVLPIDFRTTPEAAKTNQETGQEAMRRMQEADTLGIFPSGAVATAKSFWGSAVDLPKRFGFKLIQMSQATVVPIYFHGQNSRLFHVVSQFSMPMRLGMLLYETKNKMGKTIRFKVGDPIPYSEMEPYQERTNHGVFAGKGRSLPVLKKGNNPVYRTKPSSLFNKFILSSRR